MLSTIVEETARGVVNVVDCPSGVTGGGEEVEVGLDTVVS